MSWHKTPGKVVMHPQESNLVELGANISLEAASHHRGIAFILLANVQAVLKGGSWAGWQGCARSHSIWVPGAGEQKVKR